MAKPEIKEAEKRTLREVRAIRTEMVALERRLTRRIAEQAQELSRLRQELTHGPD